MCIFWNKMQNYLSVGGSNPAPICPTLLLLFTIASLSSSFLALNVFYYPQKKNKITAVNVLLLLLLHLFFISNTVALVDGGYMNASCSRAQGTLATPLLKQSWKMT